MPAVPPPPPSLPFLDGKPKPKTSTLAIWSLVLGILSIFTCGVTALPGLITGIMGMSATGDRGKGLGGRGLAIAGVVLSLVALLALIPLALAVPAYTKVVEKAKLHYSVSQGRQLVVILHQYAQDGDGSLPPDWATAFEATGVADAGLRISPLGGDSSEYLLLKPGAKLDDLSPDTAILRDPHQLDGQTVEGYADGAVKIVPAEGPSPPIGSTWETRSARGTNLVRRGPSPQEFEPITELPEGVTAVEYPSGDLRLKAWFVEAETEGNAPVMVYLHGGFAFGLEDLDAVAPFHEAGCHLFAPTWRGENGNPGSFEMAFGEVDDAVAAIAWIRKHPKVDPDRIFVLGHSAGGMIASLLAAVPGLPVAETVSVGGIYTPEAISQFEEPPFDPANRDEVNFRSLLTFQNAMERSHRAYVGREDDSVREGIPSFKKARGTKLVIIEVNGDHHHSLPWAVFEYRERVLGQ